MRNTKAVGYFLVVMMIAASVTVRAQRSNGTTLAAYKTIDICDSGAGTWVYSGVVAVWNEGVLDTVGFNLDDCIQRKAGNKFVDTTMCAVGLNAGTQVPAGTTQQTALTFPYSFEGAPINGDIRNIARAKILNHSGSLNKATGPEPKATYTGTVPPPPCSISGGGCTNTQGYWGNKPGVIWPSPYDRTAVFFLSGQTWQQVMDTPVNASQGYYQLAHQYVAAVLNAARGSALPEGVQTTLELASEWLGLNGPTACTASSSCGTQKDWAATLDLYNNGIYPGGPPHCE